MKQFEFAYFVIKQLLNIYINKPYKHEIQLITKQIILINQKNIEVKKRYL